MTNSREEFAQKLGDALGADWKIAPDPRSLGTLDPSAIGTVQIVRQRFQPNDENPQGDYLETFDVWVIGNDEDDLDDRVQNITDAIDTLTTHWWTQADRQQHPEGHNAYKITAQAITEKD